MMMAGIKCSGCQDEWTHLPNFLDGGAALVGLVGGEPDKKGGAIGLKIRPGRALA